MYLTRKSIMLLRKYLLVTESQVSKCGFHIVKKKGDVLYPKRTKYSKYRKGRCSRGCKPDGTKLGFGRYGTKSCKAGRLSYRAIEAARRAIIGHFHRAMSGQFRRNGKIWVRVFANPPALLGGFHYFILVIAPKLGRLLVAIRLSLYLLGLLGEDPALFVVPSLDLPPDTEGNEITLNPSIESLYNDIESSASVRARNLQLEEGHERIQGLERALENERDPGRRRELTPRLDQAIRALERQIQLGRRADSIRDRQIAEWRRRFNAELAREEEESANRAFLNWCLRVLIHAQERQPPQN
uniref:Large ribosomal subunit protein uL16m n=1 Tax=Turritis glabra TaxID=63678 RepID=A0A5H2UYK3_TURGL|nr:ORF297 protein [Turritis glabra]